MKQREAPKHLIFFDEECPFCQRAVRFLISIDRKEVLMFAPLEGKTAGEILSGPLSCYQHANSLVLAEDLASTNRQFHVRSKAIYRTYWLLGGKWKALGLLYWLPAWLGDPLYRWVANHRHQFKLKPMRPIGPKDRFLE